MTEKKSLARKIAALTASDTFDGRAMQLGPSGEPESLTYLLRAVDDTMLQRDAVFSVGARSVTLRISGKRVQMLVAASPEFDVPSSHLMHPLGADTQDEITTLEIVLRSLVSEKGTLTVERRAVSDDTGSAGSGVGVQTLSASWHVDLDAERAGPMSRFLAAFGPNSDAMIVTTDGATTSVTGAEADIATLEAILSRDLDGFHTAHKGFLSGSETQSLRVIDRLAPKGQVLAVVAIDDAVCVALLAEQVVGQVATAWTAAFS